MAVPEAISPGSRVNGVDGTSKLTSQVASASSKPWTVSGSSPTLRTNQGKDEDPHRAATDPKSKGSGRTWMAAAPSDGVLPQSSFQPGSAGASLEKS